MVVASDLTAEFGFHPLIARWFARRFGQPTAPQQQGWPAIAAGENTLIAAPTGSGKTLTAFLAVMDRLVKEAEAGQLADEIRVVYISPLRALSNDMHRNLSDPLAELKQLAEEEGWAIPALKVGLRTGDTTQSQRAALLKKPPHILVTTPESLYLMLTGDKGRERLRTTEVVIVDEIHALMRDKRGSHLALSLERLEHLCGRKLQRIGLSATQKPLELVAKFLVGIGEENAAWLVPSPPLGGEGQGEGGDPSRADHAKSAASRNTGHFESVLQRSPPLPNPLPRGGGEGTKQKALLGLAEPRPTLHHPTACTIIDIGHTRELDLGVEMPTDDLSSVCTHEQWDMIHGRLVELIEAHRSTVIFVNTRRLAERLTHSLSERLGPDMISSHHGSLSAELRHKTEQRLKTGQLKAVVATASLELGLDVGYIDLVVQMGSPRSIATFLQRIGRSGHCLHATPKGRIVPLTRDELLECLALLRAVKARRLDAIRPPEKPLDVLVQQIVAEASCQEWDVDELFALCKRAYPYRHLQREEYEEALRFLSEGFVSNSGRGKVYLHYDRVGKRIRPRPMARPAAISNGGAIPETATYRVVAEPEHTVVGSVDEDFAIESMRGDVFLLGNTSWQILNVRGTDVTVADAHGAPPTIPFWFGEGPGRTRELSEEVSRLRSDLEARVDDIPAAIDWLIEETNFASVASRVRCADRDEFITTSPGDGPHSGPYEESSRTTARPLSLTLSPEAGARGQENDFRIASLIVNYVATEKAAIGVVPRQDKIVFERFFDETGGMQLVVHAPFGAGITRAWGYAMRKRFCRSFDFELQATADDDGFILSIGPQHSFPIESLFGMLTSANVRTLLEQAILVQPVFQVRWRWNVTRALLVLRQKFGQKVPPALQRFRADDLLTSVFPNLTGCQENHTGDIEIPDHPLVRQTMHDCLHEALDIDGLEDVLRRVERGELEMIARDTREPSPFCYELLNSNPYTFLDGGEIQERRARAVATPLGSSLDGLKDLSWLDPLAISQVIQEATPLVRSADELHDFLLSVIVLPRNVGWAERSESHQIVLPELVGLEDSAHPTNEWLADLEQQCRAVRWQLPDGREAWSPIERWPAIAAVWLDAKLPDGYQIPAGVPLDWESTTARMAMLRGWLEICGPVRPSALAEQLGFTVDQTTATLDALEGEGTVLRGHFTPPQSPPMASAGPISNDELEWCHRRLLARIHRLTLQGLRKQIEPVAVADFQRFLFDLHGLTGESPRAGANGLFEVLSLLQGLDLPAAAWERDLLAARLADYEPAWLDDLCLSGEAGWGRLYPPKVDAEKSRPAGNLTKVVPISVFLRADLPWLTSQKPLIQSPLAPASGERGRGEGASASRRSLEGSLTETLPENRDDSKIESLHRSPPLPNPLPRGGGEGTGNDGLGSLAAELRELLSRDGALFAGDLLQATRMLPSHLSEALGELIARGLVTADGFSGLRMLIADKLDAATRSTDGPPRGYVRSRTVTSGSGRWSLWRRPLAEVDAAQHAANVEAWAWQLLRRWGVIFRDLLERETGAPRWWELLQIYRRLEARGELRGGRFIAGVAGEQFALESTVRRLREIRDESAKSEVGSRKEDLLPPSEFALPPSTVCLSAADPLNQTGILDNTPRVPALAGNRVVYQHGIAVAALIAGEIVWLTDVSETDRAAIGDLIGQSAAGRMDARRRRSSRRSERRRDSPARIPRPIIR